MGLNGHRAANPISFAASANQQLHASLSRMVEKPDEPEQTTPAGHRIPVPTRETFDRLVKKVAPPPVGRKRPAETDEPPEQSER
jgi:hypothetical protein